MIDLKSMIQTYPECMVNRNRLKSFLQDVYPEEKRMVNLIVILVECGITEKIRKLDVIDKDAMDMFIHQLYNEYGISSIFAYDAIIQWATALDKKINKIKIPLESKNTVVTEYPAYANPINHQPITSSMPEVIGEASDYKIIPVSGGVLIEKFLGFDESDFVIPSIISGKRVVGIGKAAFKGCKGIQRLTIPEGIVYINSSAFYDCSSLYEVLFPSSLRRIGQESIETGEHAYELGAFGKTAVQKIYLPSNLISIGRGAFCDCKNLTDIQLPDKLTEIGEWAFFGCMSLREVNLPPRVRKINAFAFGGCKSLAKVSLNEGLREIGFKAFESCDRLAEILIPRTVNEIEKDVFKRDGFMRQPITIKCYSGSVAIEYARANNLRLQRA